MIRASERVAATTGIARTGRIAIGETGISPSTSWTRSAFRCLAMTYVVSRGFAFPDRERLVPVLHDESDAAFRQVDDIAHALPWAMI